jgi:sulfur dioxygenase
MIVKRFVDPVSSTHTYVIAKSKGGKAVIIDPVISEVERYVDYLNLMGLTLTKALDTHVHADHITALPWLRKSLKCITMAGKESQVKAVSVRFKDGDIIKIDKNLELKVLSTPGHTSDSYCFHMEGMVFTGDTLFIRGCGRTDFQNGSSKALYESIQEKLFTLPDSTVVYPGHDYKGELQSTIGLEKKENPRLANKSQEEFVHMMDNLNLPNPKLMDIAVPANMRTGEDLKVGLKDSQQIKKEDISKYSTFVDLREKEEIEISGTIENSLNIPYAEILETLNDEKSQIRELLSKIGEENVIFFCAHGERSYMIVSEFKNRGIDCKHLQDGFEE